MAKRMNGSGDFADQVQELRARIADLKAEIAILEGAPRLVGVAIQEAERWVQARAAEFRPSTSLFWNRASAADNFALFGFALPSDTRQLEATLCACAGEQVLALLRRQIQAEIGMHGGGIADGERAQRLNALRGELRRAEIAEEELIEAAEDRGIVIDRRADAAPRIYLGLWRLDEPQAA